MVSRVLVFTRVSSRSRAMRNLFIVVNFMLSRDAVLRWKISWGLDSPGDSSLDNYRTVTTFDSVMSRMLLSSEQLHFLKVIIIFHSFPPFIFGLDQNKNALFVSRAIVWQMGKSQRICQWISCGSCFYAEQTHLGRNKNEEMPLVPLSPIIYIGTVLVPHTVAWGLQSKPWSVSLWWWQWHHHSRHPLLFGDFCAGHKLLSSLSIKECSCSRQWVHTEELIQIPIMKYECLDEYSQMSGMLAQSIWYLVPYSIVGIDIKTNSNL